ncbi:MAG: hypothetical protein WA400_13350, partial [Silvibacterium sp.]
VAVEKLDLCRNCMILGDGKWSVNAYESFIGHPDAKSFWTFSRIRVFQQPRDFALIVCVFCPGLLPI